MTKILCLCIVSLSVSFAEFATNYNYDSTTTPDYNYELVEDEIVTEALTDKDVPEAIISYSDEGGFRVQVPARPWFKEIAIRGYLNRSVDWDPNKFPEPSLEVAEMITEPNEKGEWILESKEYVLKSGDNGYINVVIWLGNEFCLMGLPKTFKFTKLSNGTWITGPRGFIYEFIPGLPTWTTLPPWKWPKETKHKWKFLERTSTKRSTAST